MTIYTRRPPPPDSKIPPPEHAVYVGWREWAALPDLGIPAIKAKIDTGAKTSALHVEDLDIIVDGAGVRRAVFTVHPVQQKKTPAVRVSADIVEERAVRSSNGVVQKRYVIRTRLVIGGSERQAHITLAKRDMMRFRMLIGREAMTDIAVLPSESFLCGEYTPKQAAKLYNG